MKRAQILQWIAAPRGPSIPGRSFPAQARGVGPQAIAAAAALIASRMRP
jgi:hypothetical protein